MDVPAPPSHPNKAPDVIVIGAGVIGLGIAWRLAQRGARVSVYDKGVAGAGASHAAAGMLAACVEAEPGEEALLHLGRASQSLWPDFACELRDGTGIDVELRQEGTLVVALTADDAARLSRDLAFARGFGLPLEWMSPGEARKREPHLGSRLAGAIFSPEDHQVDNRKLVQALRRAAETAGVLIHEHAPVTRVTAAGGRLTGVHLISGSFVAAENVVLAAGAWSREIEGVPFEARPPVRPLKGQMLALQMDASAPLLRHVLWAPNVYLVPRHDGRVLLGATVEERGFDASLTAGGILSLLEATWRVLPAIEELPIAEMWVGHRPGSRDDAPILGPSPLHGLVYATGHHRNGILLAPITADAISQLVLAGEIQPSMRPFGIERFAPVRAAAE